jgi:hypothetical protein
MRIQFDVDSESLPYYCTVAFAFFKTLHKVRLFILFFMSHCSNFHEMLSHCTFHIMWFVECLTPFLY